MSIIDNNILSTEVVGQLLAVIDKLEEVSV